MITDAQVHMWDPRRADRDSGREVTRSELRLPNGFGRREMLPEMDAVGVGRAVIVPHSAGGEGNETALEAAAASPARFAVMGRLNLQQPDARDLLEGWLAQPGMLGIRMSFGSRPSVDWLEDGSIEWFWAACERLQIPVMAWFPGITEKARPIAQRHPGLRLVIDHLGAVNASETATPFAGVENLLALAAYPNVTVKTSAAPSYSFEPYPYRDVYPYLRRIYEAFGPRRMLWGADLTRVTATYSECLRHFRDDLDFLSTEDKAWVLGKATAEVLSWPEA